MAPYSVTLSNNCITDVSELDADDFDELGLEWALSELKLERIEWIAFDGNEPSRALARSVGFTIEGTLRNRMVHRGKRTDVWIGSLLPGDPL